MPLGIVPGDQQAAAKSPYTYSASASTPRQAHAHNHTLSGGDQGVGLPRFSDTTRAMKSPRTAGQQSIHGSGALGGHETQSDYRYNTYASIPGDAQNANYGTEPPTPGAAPHRDYYPSASTWTTTTGDTAPTAAYAAGDTRPYAFPQDSYKPGPASTGTVKTELGGTQQFSNAYHGAPRGAFVDALNNYSWGSN